MRMWQAFPHSLSVVCGKVYAFDAKVWMLIFWNALTNIAKAVSNSNSRFSEICRDGFTKCRRLKSWLISDWNREYLIHSTLTKLMFNKRVRVFKIKWCVKITEIHTFIANGNAILSTEGAKEFRSHQQRRRLSILNLLCLFIVPPKQIKLIFKSSFHTRLWA